MVKVIKPLLQLIVVTSFCLALVNKPLQAAISHNADFDWYTFESEHFKVHYHNGGETIARQAVAIAERVHQQLSPWIAWQPEDKTDLLVTDEYDVSNGYATPIPSNRSVLYISAPDELNSLEDHDGWLENLITHEYLHILHLDKHDGSASYWRNIFGRGPLLLLNAFPNATQTGWAIEGLATYKETDKQRGIGRGQSSYFEMMMRAEIEQGIKPIHQVNQPISSWPMNTTTYLYGVHFYQFIQHRYGEQAIQQLVGDFSKNFIPYRINNNTRSIFNKDLVQLWAEFNDYLQQRYQPQIDRVRQKGIVAGDRLSQNGYFDGPLKALEDGRIFYIRYDAQRHAALMKIDNGQTKKIANAQVGARLDVHKTAGVLLIQPELCNNAQLFYDLYRVDSDSGATERLTHCARYRMASWSPDGKQIIAVQNHMGTNELHLLDATSGKKLKTLWQGKPWEVVAAMDWSPLGQSLVAAVWRSKTGWNLEQFDISSASWTALTRDAVIENHPVYSADGRSVLFTAEQDGIYNLQRIELHNARRTGLSNVLGGAFYPVQVGDNGDIYYAGYNPQGMDIYQLKVSQQKVFELAKPAAGTTAILQPPPANIKTSPVVDYSAWDTLRPRWWLPYFNVADNISQYGVISGGTDLLNRHIYSLVVAYDFDNETTVGSFDYIYDRFWPIFKIHNDRTISIQLDNNNQFARARLSQVNQLEVIFPMLKLDDTVALHIAALEDSEKDVRLASGISNGIVVKDRLLGAAVVYNSALYYPKSISRSEGREITLVYEDSDVFSGSFYRGSVATADWREFFALGGSHVLALRGVAVRGEQGSKSVNLGGFNNNYFAPGFLNSTVINSPFNRRHYDLRGYSEGIPALSGRKLNLLSAEYRFPLARPERGFMIPPIGVYQLHAALFVDVGSVWNNASADKYYSGAGMELTTESFFFFSAKFNFTLGVAHGFDEQLGEDKAYVRLGTSF